MSSPAIANSNHRPKPLTASSMLNTLMCLSLRGWRHGSKLLSKNPPPLACQVRPPRPAGQRARMIRQAEKGAVPECAYSCLHFCIMVFCIDLLQPPFQSLQFWPPFAPQPTNQVLGELVEVRVGCENPHPAAHGDGANQQMRLRAGEDLLPDSAAKPQPNCAKRLESVQLAGAIARPVTAQKREQAPRTPYASRHSMPGHLLAACGHLRRLQ